MSTSDYLLLHLSYIPTTSIDRILQPHPIPTSNAIHCESQELLVFDNSSSVPTSMSTTEDNQLHLTPSSSVLSEESEKAAPAQIPLCLSALADCLLSGRYADAAVKCQKYVFNVHAIVLYGSGSAYLQRLLIAAYLDDKGRLTIKLDDVEPAVVGRMLIWLYTGRYSVAQLAETSPLFIGVEEPRVEDVGVDFGGYRQEELRQQTLHLLLHAAAKDFGLPSLQEEALRGSCRALKGDIEFTNNFNAASVSTQQLVKTVYAETSKDDRSIRDIVLKQLHYDLHSRELDRYFGDADRAEEGVLKIISEMPALAVDMASSSLTAGNGKCTTCLDCCPRFPALMRPCSCGKLKDCINSECVEQRMKPQYCSCCGAFTLFPPMTARAATENVHSAQQQAQSTAGWVSWASSVSEGFRKWLQGR